MRAKFELKYNRILEMLSDVAGCAQNQLILVGGTALAIFYLKHRTSIDIDLVPIGGDESTYKELLKGCLSKKGYRTKTATYANQFVVQFDDTTIKVEIFYPQHKIQHTASFEVNGRSLLVASLDDLLKLKLDAYKDRKAPRDLFDIVFILKSKTADFSSLKELIRESGLPENLSDLKNYILSQSDYDFFLEVIKNAS